MTHHHRQIKRPFTFNDHIPPESKVTDVYSFLPPDIHDRLSRFISFFYVWRTGTGTAACCAIEAGEG